MAPVAEPRGGGTPPLPTLDDARDVMVPDVWRVAGKRQETDDVWTLDLERDGDAPFAFRPGQFNMLYAFGTGEVPISISGDPQKTHRLVHTIRAAGLCTAKLCALEAGDELGVRGPYGAHWPIDEVEGDDVVIVAGGIGLAPLRPVIYHLLAHRERYGNATLLYGTRTPEDRLFVDELERWIPLRALDVEVTVDHASPGWRGDVGLVTRLIGRARMEPRQTSAFLCGPEIMMRFVARELLAAGVQPARLFVSMERNMKCAVGLCGHCQLGPSFVCQDGPVYTWERAAPFFSTRGL